MVAPFRPATFQVLEGRGNVRIGAELRQLREVSIAEGQFDREFGAPFLDRVHREFRVARRHERHEGAGYGRDREDADGDQESEGMRDADTDRTRTREGDREGGVFDRTRDRDVEGEDRFDRSRDRDLDREDRDLDRGGRSPDPEGGGDFPGRSGNGSARGRTIEGTILAIGGFAGQPTLEDAVRVRIRTDAGETVVVGIAPRSKFESWPIRLAKGDRIEIGGETVFLATKLARQGETLVLVEAAAGEK